MVGHIGLVQDARPGWRRFRTPARGSAPAGAGCSRRRAPSRGTRCRCWRRRSALRSARRRPCGRTGCAAAGSPRWSPWPRRASAGPPPSRRPPTAAAWPRSCSRRPECWACSSPDFGVEPVDVIELDGDARRDQPVGGKRREDARPARRPIRGLSDQTSLAIRITPMLHDLKHAYRMLLHTKGWTTVVLLSLALGIGATTALFTAVNGLLLQTVPVPRSAVAGDPEDGPATTTWSAARATMASRQPRQGQERAQHVFVRRLSSSSRPPTRR